MYAYYPSVCIMVTFVTVFLKFDHVSVDTVVMILEMLVSLVLMLPLS